MQREVGLRQRAEVFRPVVGRPYVQCSACLVQIYVARRHRLESVLPASSVFIFSPGAYMAERPSPLLPGTDEQWQEQVRGTTKCPACESVFRVDQQLVSCRNCGKPLVLDDVLPVGSQRRSVGTMAFLKGVADIADSSMHASGLMRDTGSASAGQRSAGPVTCSWCSAHFNQRPESPNCLQCGGVLPSPPGFDPGPQPPASPRKLPKSFFWRLFVKQNRGAMFGLALMLIGIPFLCMVVGIPMMLFGAFLSGGNTLVAWRRWSALRHGDSTLGKIEAVHQFGDAKDSKPMYRIYFRFDAEGEHLRGLKYTYDPEIENHFVGEPVWIVYLPRNLNCYNTWPPLA